MKAYFRPPAFDDPATERLARRLHLVLWAGVVASLVFILVQYSAPRRSPVFPLIALSGHLILLRLLYTQALWAVARFYVTAGWFVLAYGALRENTIIGPSYFSFISIVLIGGVLFGLPTGLLLAGASAAIGIYLTLLAAPADLPSPEHLPELLAIFALNFLIVAVIIFVATRDLRAALEDTRLSRQNLRERAVGLAAAAEVGRAAASFHNLDELLPTVTQLISERFGFYHASIYLLEADNETLCLRASNSAAGEKMLAAGHTYKVGAHGIISQVAATASAYTALDTRNDPLHLPNPLLPDTRAEIALPLVAGNRLFGVLDVQSTFPNAFDPQNIEVLSVLADQVAIAIQNAHLLDQAASRNQLLADLAAAGSALTAELDFNSLLATVCEKSTAMFKVDSAFLWLVEGDHIQGTAGEGMGRDVFLKLRIPLDDSRTLGANVIRQKTAIVVNQARQSPLVNLELAHLFGAEAILGVPLIQQERAIGALMLIDCQNAQRFDRADSDAAQLFANQLVTAIENARLFNATRRRVDELTVLHGLSLAGIEATTEDELIQRATQLIGSSLFPDNFGILFLDPEHTSLLHHGSYWEGTHDREPIPPLTHGVCWDVAQTGRPARIGDVSQLESYVEIDPHTRSELCVPFLVEGRIIGVINTENHKANAFSEDDERLLLTVAAQLGIILEKLRLSNDESRRSAELRGLYEIAEAFKTMTNVEETFGTLAERLANLIDAQACIVALYDPNSGYLIAQRPGYGVTDDVLARARYPAVEGGKLWSFRRNGAFRANTISEIPPLFSELSKLFAVTNVLVAPMLREERFLGAVFALNKREGFTEDDERLLSVFASQAGAVIENTRLYAEAQERAKDLAKALAKQEELDRLKSEFVQNVSHELRTPLAIIKGYIELLDSGELGSMPPDYAEPVSIIRRRVDMLNKMISDLTALLETQNVGLRPQTVDLRALVHHQLLDFAVVAEKARLHLKQELAENIPPLRGDPEMLRRVLDNLLGNALKFTPLRGTITVRLFVQAGNIILEVSDTGPGIPVSEQARIFERFYQVDGSSTRKHGGTGLGLALVKEIAEKHGGSISVESRLNQGSTFRMSLPILPLEDPATQVTTR